MTVYMEPVDVAVGETTVRVSVNQWFSVEACEILIRNPYEEYNTSVLLDPEEAEAIARALLLAAELMRQIS